MGILTEGSIEKGNQDVKQICSKLVARLSMENIHKNALAMSHHLCVFKPYTKINPGGVGRKFVFLSTLMNGASRKATKT